ncbi:MAG: hypothetical protein MSS60_11545 [Clostridiales bacterium]|nr:hypothetical protein [Clostridiales bacterium]
MFTKLLKHEWRATRGMLGTLCLVCLGASLLGGGTMRYLMIASTQDAQQNVIVVLNVLAMVAAMIAVAVVGVAALFVYIGRFYKSRFTDEGYLTFTLPVSTHQNLLASMANTAIGMVIVFFVICAALAIWLSIGFSGIPDFYQTVWEKLPELWDVFKRVWSTIPWNFFWVFLLDVLAGSVCELVVLMLSVTIGSILAKKHKILAAVGVYYGIHVALSMVTSFTMAMGVFSGTDGKIWMLRYLGGMALLMAAVSIVGYFLMYALVDRKLNLN